MNLTRRQALKSLAVTAALAVVPSTVKAIDISPKPKAVVSYTPTKAESIYAKIKELISKCEKERGLPFDPQRDIISIYLPASFGKGDLNATATLFQRDYPTCLRCAFRVFYRVEAIDVNMHRVADEGDSEGAVIWEVDPKYSISSTHLF